jgi:UDP-N-acetyl-D-galactosamine dehydrogenase
MRLKSVLQMMKNMHIKDIRICVIGLGYVGLPLARLFSTKFKTVGFDLNKKRVHALMQGYDTTLEVADGLLASALQNGFKCTADIEEIKDCNFYIIAVPTPVDNNNRPDLRPLQGASKTVGQVISKGDVVVYESTVYPGVTEEECLPVVERVSGLIFNEDFFAGYSPERINPGDKLHTVEKIKKVTSGSTPEIADLIDSVYNSVLINGTHKAPSIRVAEASKIIENSQRDVNIAFMNELAKIFNAMDIDTHDVIDAASSKWNFIKFNPGLVGGHCISVDPYYLIQKAQVYGILPRVMSNARRLNDGMGDYVANQVIKIMNKKGVVVKDSNILLLGITFKENCPDIRNTKIVDIYYTFKEYTDNITIYDPWADQETVRKVYNIDIISNGINKINIKFDAVVLCVSHQDFKDLDIRSFLKDRTNGVVYDVKGVLDRKDIDGRL